MIQVAEDRSASESLYSVGDEKRKLAWCCFPTDRLRSMFSKLGASSDV
jgi:hypothetical protein